MGEIERESLMALSNPRNSLYFWTFCCTCYYIHSLSPFDVRFIAGHSHKHPYWYKSSVRILSLWQARHNGTISTDSRSSFLKWCYLKAHAPMPGERIRFLPTIMRFNNDSRVILQTDVMILPSCGTLILVSLLAIFHQVLRAAVAVIDKTDCIMENINMLISLRLSDRIYWVDSMWSLPLFSLEKFKMGLRFTFYYLYL